MTPGKRAPHDQEDPACCGGTQKAESGHNAVTDTLRARAEHPAWWQPRAVTPGARECRWAAPTRPLLLLLLALDLDGAGGAVPEDSIGEEGDTAPSVTDGADTGEVVTNGTVGA